MRTVLRILAVVTLLSALTGCASMSNKATPPFHAGPPVFEGIRTVTSGPGQGAVIKTTLQFSLTDNNVTGVSDSAFSGRYRIKDGTYKINVSGVIEKKSLGYRLSITGTVSDSMFRGTFVSTFDGGGDSQRGTIELKAR